LLLFFGKAIIIILSLREPARFTFQPDNLQQQSPSLPQSWRLAARVARASQPPERVGL
jgi:hypothetical protein